MLGSRTRRTCLLACLTLIAAFTQGCAATVERGSYNKGVDAWRRQDYAAAAREWSVAVLSGDTNAMNNLAYLYFNGMGTERRIDDAIALWRLASYSGNSESQWHLGYAYQEGIGVEKDLVAAYAWYSCAIETAQRLAARDESGTEAKIAADAKSSLAGLEGQLAPEPLASALVLRSKLIERYSAAAP